jgi:hypothetical protein
MRQIIFLDKMYHFWTNLSMATSYAPNQLSKKFNPDLTNFTNKLWIYLKSSCGYRFILPAYVPLAVRYRAADFKPACGPLAGTADWGVNNRLRRLFPEFASQRCALLTANSSRLVGQCP